MGCFLLTLSYFAFQEKEPLQVTEKAIFSSEAFADYFKKQGYFLEGSPADLNRRFVDEMRKKGDVEQIKNMFIGVNLTKAYENFLFSQIPCYEKGDFFGYLSHSLALLKENPRFQKSKTTLTNDSYAEGNLPFLQFQLGQTKVIRMGLPIVEAPYYQTFFFTPKINPEFLAFVRSQDRYLYVNLMKRSGLEGPFSHALESLEEIEPTFAVVTLDKNSDFYWQKGDYPESSQEFKGLFLKKMLDPKGDYYWSKHLKLNLKDLLEEVDIAYFDRKDKLSRPERKDFIELTYLEILDHLKETLAPSTMNITCKHAIDRAPSLAVLWQLKHHLANENEVAALLLAPPLLMHNRTSHQARLDRFISAARFFYSKKNEGDRIR